MRLGFDWAVAVIVAEIEIARIAARVRKSFFIYVQC